MVTANPRRAGILLHPTSLPGPGPCGTLGAGARQLVDWLAAAGQSLWQVLPLGPTDGSPYSAFSSMAGDPRLIDVAELGAAGLIDEDPGNDRASDALATAFTGLAARPDAARRFRRSAHAERSWLDDYALFMAIREEQRTWWLEWPEPLLRRQRAALRAARRRLAERIDYHRFVQFVFLEQWRRLRSYANERGIAIVGDMSFYVATDSADVWSERRVFDVDPRTRRPRSVGGVPPDFFSEKGQLWGMPCYRFGLLRRRPFRWWSRRFGKLLELVDIVRIDHFRGFAAFWRVPAGAPDAVGGAWVRAPGRSLLRRVRRDHGPFVGWAEDLGHITPDVIALRDELGFAGTKVLQFAFHGGPGNGHLPVHHRERDVVYTGTHDNDTTLGWWEDLDDEARSAVARHCAPFEAARVHWHLIHMAMDSRAHACVVPLQDVVGLGKDARMNLPGTTTGNWGWRCPEGVLTAALAAELRSLTRQTGRADE